MQAQPDIAIGAHEQMLAMTATGFETAPFQPVCKLTRSDALQNISAQYIDVSDALMQRRGVEVSLETFDIRQLWHRVPYN